MTGPCAHTPQSIRRPFGRYSHAMEVPPGARLLFTSGQLGMRPDDTVPQTIGAQAEQCFENIGAILAAAGMTFSDVVRLSACVTTRDDFAAYMAVRDRYMSDPPPASTLVIVTGFTRPEFKVEVEATAARVDNPRDTDR
jgi:2-iminobutanoate/2-iminopropanoate deaminase